MPFYLSWDCVEDFLLRLVWTLVGILHRKRNVNIQSTAWLGRKCVTVPSHVGLTWLPDFVGCVLQYPIIGLTWQLDFVGYVLPVNGLTWETDFVGYVLQYTIVGLTVDRCRAPTVAKHPWPNQKTLSVFLHQLSSPWHSTAHRRRAVTTFRDIENYSELLRTTQLLRTAQNYIELFKTTQNCSELHITALNCT